MGRTLRAPTHEKPTSFDIAQLAGVSQPTVSRALRGEAMVSESTRKRVEAIASQLNYKVDKHASSLRLRQSKTLALLFFEDPTADNSLINPFYLSMLGSITRTCGIRGYDLLISFQQLSSDWHVDYEDSRKADGIILLGYGDYDEYRWRLDRLAAQGTHFVRWGSMAAGQPSTTLGTDNFEGGAIAARHLIALGHRAIAFLGEASSRSPEFEERYRGALTAMRAAGVAPNSMLQVDAVSTEASGYAAACALIARQVPFEAIFAASDLIAVGALRAFEEHGLSVPGDVSVVGFDDISAASLSHPPLTTVAQDYARAGRVLVDALLGQIAARPLEITMLPPRLVVRRSTAPLGAGR